MIKAFIVDQEISTLDRIRSKLSSVSPEINICGNAACIKEAVNKLEVHHPNLFIINAEQPNALCFNYFSILKEAQCQIILTSSTLDNTLPAIHHQVCGYLLKPITEDALSQAIDNALSKIQAQKEKREQEEFVKKILKSLNTNEVVGIPTIDGFEFLKISEIIRCEGLQKCTRIVTKSKSDIISSYNIGEFRKLLSPYNFFATHKSHLINLSLIRTYYKEGTLKMVDGSYVPVAKRKKSEFLKQLNNL